MAKVGLSGGEAMQKRLEAVLKKIGTLPHVRVGFLENATYPDGTSVAMVAAIQEFGAPRARIPPRPFFRTMIARHKQEWGPALGRILKLNGYDAGRSLSLLGDVIKGQLQQSIVELDSPPLGAITLMLRWMQWKDPDLVVTGRTVGEAARRVAQGKSSAGVSTKPLVWTGKLLNAVDYEVIR